MAKSPNIKRDDISTDEIEFARLEFGQAIETFRTQFSLAIQILTVFVVADVTIIGYAISSQIAGIFIAGALIPLMMILVIVGVGKFMIPVLYTAAIIESRYGKRNIDWLVSTFTSVVVSSKFIRRIQDISRIDNHEERIALLKKQRLEMIDRPHFRALLFVLSLLHIVSAAVLNIFFGWRIL
jgi:hypothetical protein